MKVEQQIYKTDSIGRKYKKRRTYKEICSQPSKHKIIENKSKGHCWYCGYKFEDVGHFINQHIDHQIPKSRGGTNDISNLVHACAKCNKSKGAKNLEEYRAYVINKNNDFSGQFYGESL